MMSLARFAHLVARGSGPDGSALAADDPQTGRPVLVHILDTVRADPWRWRSLTRRLRQLELLTHPGIVPVIELALDHSPPFVVLPEVVGPSLGDQLPASPTEAIADLLAVADALAAAHHVGLAHGRLGLQTVVRTPDGLRLDCSGLATRASDAPASDDLADDQLAFGRLILALNARSEGLDELISRLLSEEPAERPALSEVRDVLAGRLRFLADSAPTQMLPTVAAEPTAGPVTILQPGERLGRFVVRALLGKGGMGAVYKAEDPVDGSVVAIKTLLTRLAEEPKARARFLKEARLLAEVRSPHVVNLLEINEHNGIDYLVLEFVAGRNARDWLFQRGRLSQDEALNLACDVARALAETHERGIIHRDIKPENILIEDSAAGSRRAKLSDFGLARHVEQSESLALTQEAAIGTPLYMAPEQAFHSQSVDARTDIYALGATLFHLLSGQPPFLGDTPLDVLMKHAQEPLPDLQRLVPDLSDGLCRIIAKCLAKKPAERFGDGAELLAALERLRRGEPATLAVHPQLPPHDPTRVRDYVFTWDLNASPLQLWPHVSNTERLNRAIGLGAVAFATEPDTRGGSRRYGSFRKAGFVAVWEEHPFEWIEGRRLGVLRVLKQGPFAFLASTVELEPRWGGGTRLTHRVRVAPHGLFGRWLAAIEIGWKTRHALDRVYRRIDAVVSGQLDESADPFESPPRLSSSSRRRLDDAVDRLIRHGADAVVAHRLGEYLEIAPAQEVARLRPYALARRLRTDSDLTVACCLRAAHEGLLVMLWDILCPVCRVPTQIRDTLKQVQDHARCEACNLDFELDFANSVEMIFRPHPEIRSSELGTYCIGGPGHSPHVAAQVRVAAGEHLALALALEEGAYRLRGPQLPFAIDFRVAPEARSQRLVVDLTRPPLRAGLLPTLRPGEQTLVLTNDSPAELLVRVERTASRSDALTAARAASLALFRELFPNEILSPGQLISMATMSFLVVQPDGIAQLYRERGDAATFRLIREFLALTGDQIKQAGGALVKTTATAGVLAVFNDPLAAVQTALNLPTRWATTEAGRQVPLRLGIHRGPALAVTLDDHLDYFGAIVTEAMRLPEQAAAGGVALSANVAADPSVAEWLAVQAIQNPSGPNVRIVSD